MFLHNKYTTWYFNIINRAKLRIGTRRHLKKIYSYIEYHHIIPKSIMQNDDTVPLTAREHFICHWLLTKMVIEKKHMISVQYAFARMSVDIENRRNLSSRQFARTKLAQSLAAKLSYPDNEHLLRGSFGPCTEHRKTKISEARKLTEKKECPFCGKYVDPGNFKNYHGDNCKLNPDISQEILENRTHIAKKCAASAIANGNHKPGNIVSLIPIICPHCGKKGTNKLTMARHHFDNCKFLTSAPNAMVASSSDIVSILDSNSLAESTA